MIVYAGTDPLTGRRLRFRQTVKTEEQAQILLGKLLGQVAEGRQPETGVTVTELLRQYIVVAQLDRSTRQTYEGYIRRTILPAHGPMELRKVRGPVLDALYARLHRCGDLTCSGKPFVEHSAFPAINVTPTGSRPVWVQVAAVIREAIAAGQLAPGEPLPSARQMADRNELPVTTVHQALAVLADERLIDVRQGRRVVIAGEVAERRPVRRARPAAGHDCTRSGCVRHTCRPPSRSADGLGEFPPARRRARLVPAVSVAAIRLGGGGPGGLVASQGVADPGHRRGHGALYDAVNCGRIEVARLRRCLAGLPLPRAADGRLMLAVDVSNWRPPADVDRCWQAFLRRFDLEHTFRMFKQVLGWTAPKLRDPAAADRWTWLTITAYTQLRLARPLAADLRLPWERPAPPGRLTPARVRRGLRNIRATLPCPAGAPKPGKPGPGRPPGSKNRRPAPRHNVGKKTKRATSLKAQRERPG